MSTSLALQMYAAAHELFEAWLTGQSVCLCMVTGIFALFIADMLTCLLLEEEAHLLGLLQLHKGEEWRVPMLVAPVDVSTPCDKLSSHFEVFFAAFAQAMHQDRHAVLVFFIQINLTLSKEVYDISVVVLRSIHQWC